MEKLQEEIRDLEGALEQQCENFASKRKRLWEEMEELQDEYRLHCQHAERVQGRLRDERKAERQRADELQRLVNSSAEQLQAAVAEMQARIESLQRQMRNQQTAAETERVELERRANVDKLRLETKVQELKNRLQEQSTQFEQERAQLLQQGARRDNGRDDIHSSLVNAMPHMRRLMEALERGSGRAESPAEPIDLTEDTPAVQASTPGEIEDEELTNRLNEQRSAFDRERAQLLEQASDAAKTQQDISRRSHAEREAVLTCPISLDLFEDPVVTECCGKTFSSDGWNQAVRRSFCCPFCRSSSASVRANRDVAKLVELHRAERSVLGLPVLPESAPSTATPGPNDTAGSSSSASGSRSRRQRSSEASSAHQSRHRTERTERVHARSEVPRRRSSRPRRSSRAATATASNDGPVAAATTESPQEARPFRRHSSTRNTNGQAQVL